MIANAQAKLARKGADFIASKAGVEDWPDLSKGEVAHPLAENLS
ncbi:hypothetical protein [Hoeflea sp.]|nr:hypothetical protein [Hoeflea sp.]